ncbi:uncharacterized protein FFUJ_13917 [Fusarium fujikuroi IMI 58289]|uniref:Uncharacterized protein n=1 Tax=Gibberella fujikuroi (strain CBS 195.34 / IMI 58289 / NRRL A-6831) TaxID=1279085 RepID=S0EBU8_GIBF5|nr:uncharacterized protein FFUJ_13917 [Fusarium fujikuroi IMI 58289]KLP14467.1 uncharacterized protein LW94_12794 [Fusarium fujikuroi]CCT72085.1 uncharacterized protein FFUJ_13917 [Fusarium fujikuroi IMI 58289]SCO18199.1 uncharacterized protein FFM5_11776 [Fusarium fujikuroi]SCO55361.1 uncharacterized protein FFMR_12517 [Fusarium fujikuroi]
MEAFDIFNERMASGESDPAILAAMARVAKATQSGMENARQEAEDAKQQADKSKKDYEARRRDFGPNQRLIIQKVDDICPVLQGKLELIEQAIEDIPRGTFMETLTQRATKALGEKVDGSVNGLVAQFETLLNSHTQTIPSIEQIDGSVRDRITANGDAVDEKLRRLKVDLQEAICAVLADAVKRLLTTDEGKQTAADTITEIKAAGVTTTEEIGHLRQAIELNKKDTLSKIETSGAMAREDLNGVRSDLVAAKEEFLVQLNSSCTDTKQGIKGVRTALDQATEAADGLVNSIRDRTRQGLNDIKNALEAQSSKLMSIQDRVEQVATSTQTMEDTIDKSKTESEGAWNRTIQMIQNGFAAHSTADGLLEAKQAILTKLDDQAQVDNAQLSKAEKAIDSSFGKVQARLGQIEQGLAEKPTEITLTSTLTGQLDLAVNRLEIKIAECENRAIKSHEYQESVAKQRALFKEYLEDCQTTMRQAAQSTSDRIERLLSDKAFEQLQQEFKIKLDAKDQEIRHLSEKVETLITNCNDKEAINRLLQQQSSSHEGQLKAREELCQAREESLRQTLSKEASSHQRTLVNLNNRETKSKIDLKAAADQLEAAENELSRLNHQHNLKLEELADLEKELKTHEQEAEEEERVHMEEIVWLKQRIKAPFEANEITKILHDMALQVMELDVYPIAASAGQAFVNELASQLLLTGSAGRLTSFVHGVDDEQWRCFIDVCKTDNVQPLPNNVCEKHNNDCPKVWVDLDKAPEKKVVYFEL